MTFSDLYPHLATIEFDPPKLPLQRICDMTDGLERKFRARAEFDGLGSKGKFER